MAKQTISGQTSSKNQQKRPQKMMNQMLAQPSWLWASDERFLSSLSAQVSERRELSGKQIVVIDRAYERFTRNQLPRVFRG